MVGRILFAWGFSEQLDNDAKMWRFAADIFNDLGMAIEIASPFAPSYMFVWLACIATLLKALCGVTGGATRASLSQHFAKTDNMADLAAKDGSQETVINLVGMIFSAFVVQFIPESNFAVTYSVFTIFTILHLLTNWMAVRSVVLHSLNTQRTDTLSRKFILAKSKVLSPVQISNEEHIFWLNSSRITLGVPISGFPINEDLWKKILDVEMIPRYIISVKSLPSQKNQISIALIEGASALDILQAYFHGVLLQESNSITDTVVTANHDSVSHFNDFIKRLEANGWDIGLENEHNRINIGPWRYSLGIKSHAE
ncbi:hypothetical protein HK098_000313 [Nowakowskiella sp. JEL0407]|nr:hypothetical protein HK098_000313 [Nowakowskiella sp. JEL0407]